MTVDAAAPRSRRALLSAAVGGRAGIAAGTLGRPLPVHAAIGDPLILGSTANSAGGDNTALTTHSTGTALLVTQTGSGTALRGSAVGPGSIAGFFTAGNGTGISGVTANSSSYGVYGGNDGAAGTGGAIRAAGGNNHGLVATTSGPGNAVSGSATTGYGVIGTSQNGIALSGTSGTAYGVYGESGSTTGVVGRSTGGIGVHGSSVSGSGTGVLGTSSSTGIGVYGLSSANQGVYGASTSGTGVYGVSTSGYAGYFVGPAHVTGTLTKGGGGFKIDHPLDPARKYLTHSFVESPDMKNVYDGLVTLNAKGEAIVELPGYFGALNRDTRVQLTAVGSAAAELHVKAKVSKGRFRIAGGLSGQEVYWQVTGIRQDAFAEAHRIVVEEAKPAAERGLYLHPELYGQSEEKGLDWQHRPQELKELAAG